MERDLKDPMARGARPFVAETPDHPGAANASEDGAVAWDCVPSYWLGYWAWAWQPCAWIDRSYVQGAIGAVASAGFTEATEVTFLTP